MMKEISFMLLMLLAFCVCVCVCVSFDIVKSISILLVICLDFIFFISSFVPIKQASSRTSKSKAKTVPDRVTK